MCLVGCLQVNCVAVSSENLEVYLTGLKTQIQMESHQPSTSTTNLCLLGALVPDGRGNVLYAVKRFILNS